MARCKVSYCIECNKEIKTNSLRCTKHSKMYYSKAYYARK